ncbi:MAG: sigma-54 dependent transcriptional regulator [Rhodothermales bacterium]
MDRSSLQERFGIIGTSPGIRHVIDRVRQIAATGITALIEGESGVGKELVAHAIHDLSARRHKTMLIVNCGAIPEGLIESELFGAEKGAYTGAVERRTGYFEEANASTIFLDEIGEMPLTAQVRLLRVLETGEFSRVGASNLLKSDVRVIAATNKDLAREVEAGRFREDLYYRLSTVIIRVPPLRERREDILPIFEHFQHRFAQKYNSSAPRLSSDARSLFLQYRWPGNIRELRNVAEQTVVLLGRDEVTAEDVRPYLRGVSASGSGVGLVPVGHAAGQESFSSDSGQSGKEREIIYRALIELREEVRGMKEQMALMAASGSGTGSGSAGVARGEHGHSAGHSHGHAAGPAPSGRATAEPEDAPRYLMLHGGDEDRYIEDVPYELDEEGAASVENDDPSRLPTLEEAERTLIATALERFEGNRRQTAEALGISERTLYRKLKDMDVLDE